MCYETNGARVRLWPEWAVIALCASRKSWDNQPCNIGTNSELHFVIYTYLCPRRELEDGCLMSAGYAKCSWSKKTTILA